MKCIRNTMTGEVVRVSNEVAAERTSGIWAYCAKSLWKTGGRK